MREIRFRYVWKRKEDGHLWVEDVPIECLEGRGDSVFVHGDNELWELIARDQFTGLRDAIGKEIYEGDILERYSGMVPKGSNPLIRRVVKWHLYQWDGINGWSGAEVIGNVHENPELIGG